MLVILLAIYFAKGEAQIAVGSLPQEVTAAGLMSKKSITTSSERRELPPERYAKLRAQALANVSFHVGPKLKNPQISNNGLDPAILSSLQEQREYLERKWPLMSGPRSGSLLAALPGHGSDTSPAPKRDFKPQLLSQTGLSASANPSGGICRTSAIRSVNGKATDVVFTPQTPNNAYKIEGCFFGKVRGQLQLEPHPAVFGQSALPIALQIDSSAYAWSDTEIDAHLDPRFSGIPDSPVTLVIYPGKGQRLEMPGCLFVALRGAPQLLSVIPSPWVKLHASTVGSRSIKQLEYVSPPAQGSVAPSDAAKTSVFVVRSDSENFGAGRDTYDFSHLNPGWVVDSVQLQTYSVPCPGDVTYVQSLGRWNTEWNQKTFTVTWQDDVCESYISSSFSFNLSFSQYAAKVWVIGPVGTQPVSNGLLK